jgi:hypothetical protein
MTHLYIKMCDLCGRPCEVDSGLHGGSISTDIIVKKKKVSIVAFREDFDVCITCLDKMGLLKILQKMKIMKEQNAHKKLKFKQMLEDKRILYQ